MEFVHQAGGVATCISYPTFLYCCSKVIPKFVSEGAPSISARLTLYRYVRVVNVLELLSRGGGGGGGGCCRLTLAQAFLRRSSTQMALGTLFAVR